MISGQINNMIALGLVCSYVAINILEAFFKYLETNDTRDEGTRAKVRKKHSSLIDFLYAALFAITVGWLIIVMAIPTMIPQGG